MANWKFALAMQRFLPFIGYHHVLMMFTITSIVILSLLVAGCSSYGTMTGIYVMSLSYTNSSSPPTYSPAATELATEYAVRKGATILNLRIGYFGICAKQRTAIWVCSDDIQALRGQVGFVNDQLNLIELAARLRQDVLFSGLLIMAIILASLCTALLSTFPGWHEEHDVATGSDVDVKPFPSRPVSQVACWAVFVAAIATLLSCMWQHVAAVTAVSIAESTGYGNIGAEVGAVAMVLGWLGFGLLTIAFIGLLVMILSIAVLDRLTDDD